MFTVHPPQEVKNQVDKLAEEIRKTLGLTRGSLLVTVEDRKVVDWNVLVKPR